MGQLGLLEASHKNERRDVLLRGQRLQRFCGDTGMDDLDVAETQPDEIIPGRSRNRGGRHLGVLIQPVLFQHVSPYQSHRQRRYVLEEHWLNQYAEVATTTIS